MKMVDREETAKAHMLNREMCTKAALVSILTIEDIPDELNECQKELRQIKRLLAGALSSHIICHARLEIAEERAQKGQLSAILKQCGET